MRLNEILLLDLIYTHGREEGMNEKQKLPERREE